MSRIQEQWHCKSAPVSSAPLKMQPERAQPWCNFAVLVPAELPAGCQLKSAGLLRKEAPPGRVEAEEGRPAWTKANTSSYITEVAGENRRLRIKQFLYDWAPPATDHPCLWEHADRPFAVDSERIGWIGTDFKGNAAASAILWGTMCEVSVLEGTFSDDELQRLYSSLRPADMNACLAILATPFAKLGYWGRFKCKLVAVPFGLWKYRRPEEDASYQWHDILKPEFAKFLPACPKGWSLDSFCILGDPKKPEEVEAIFTLGNRDRYLWSRVIYRQPVERLAYPPQKDNHPCNTAVRNVSGLELQHAWIHDDFGPHDAVWSQGGRIHMAQMNSAAGLEVDSFLGTLKDIVT